MEGLELCAHVVKHVCEHVDDDEVAKTKMARLEMYEAIDLGWQHHCARCRAPVKCAQKCVTCEGISATRRVCMDHPNCSDRFCSNAWCESKCSECGLEACCGIEVYECPTCSKAFCWPCNEKKDECNLCSAMICCGLSEMQLTFVDGSTQTFSQCKACSTDEVKFVCSQCSASAVCREFNYEANLCKNCCLETASAESADPKKPDQ